MRELSLREVWDLAMNNEIKDGFSLAALVLTIKQLGLDNGKGNGPVRVTG